MISRLSIDNYILINHLEILFPGDLVIVTGETGAGKSILLGALSLLLGAKADNSIIRDSSRNCILEAEFSTEEGEIILRRVITPQGRSRVFVNDEPTTIDHLKELSSKLVDIHSQNQHLLLASRQFQLAVVDSYAGLIDDIKRYGKLYSDYTSACTELEQLDARIAAAEKERDYTEFQYDKLAQANLREGELEELESEQKQLANSEQIRESLSKAMSIFESGDTTLESSLKEAETTLSKIAEYVPGLEEICERLSSARIELKDIAGDIEDKLGRTVSSPQRLEEVDDRIALLYDLIRRHGVSGVDELIELRDQFKAVLSIGEDSKMEREALAKRCASLRKQCEDAADSIHEKRAAAAPELSSLLQQQIRNLEMPLASFKIEVVRKDGFGKDGGDDVLFWFNANGTALRELSSCASGGELSRIMLCLKSLMSNYMGMPTMVFDEIDTGVSGSIADKMGRMIVEMGRSMQVFAITHLPQVASKGSAHYLVYKEIDGASSQTFVKKVEGEERLREIARMLSGSKITDEALANAKVLLNE